MGGGGLTFRAPLFLRFMAFIFFQKEVHELLGKVENLSGGGLNHLIGGVHLFTPASKSRYPFIVIRWGSEFWFSTCSKL